MRTYLKQLATRLPRPGLFTRISHFLVVQIVFVFAAVALIVFWPTHRYQFDAELIRARTRLSRLAESVRQHLSRTAPVDTTFPQRAKSALQAVLGEDPAVVEAQIFVSTGDRVLLPVVTYRSADVADQRRPALLQHADRLLISRLLQDPQPEPVSFLCGDNGMIHYHSLRLRDRVPAVLVGITSHDFVISNRSQVGYALCLLFLCSVLISLLMVHLISRRLKRPLNHLIKGFQKTADGELFYLFAESGDKELRKLVQAFNRMSAALRRHHTRLRKSNLRLALANRALIESQLFLATLIEHSPLAVVVTDTDGQIVVFNRRAATLFGADPASVIGSPSDRLFANGSDTDTIAATEDKPARCEVLCRRSDGSVFPAYLTASPVVTQEGVPTASLLLIRDISESKSFQEMVVRLDRYYTRGEMAGDIAHEMNNYLTVLTGNIELMPLFLRKGDTEKAQQKLAVMKQTVDKIAHFANGLMDTDPDCLTLEHADINLLVENTVAFLKPQNKFDNITITTVLAHDLGPVPVDVAQIQQLLVNLINNAAEAMSDRTDGRPSEIRITTSADTEDAEKSVDIEVRDNGPEIAADKRDLVFVKRFTTRRKGHGLGLITCRKIMERHHGTISYRGDGGAIFTITLPIRPLPPAHETDPAPADAQPQLSS